MNICASVTKLPANVCVQKIGAVLVNLQYHLQDPTSDLDIKHCRELVDTAIALIIEGSEPFLSKNIANRLTRREHDIALALSEGKSNSTIASELFISINTVRFHVRNTLRKLEAKNRNEAAALILRRTAA